MSVYRVRGTWPFRYREHNPGEIFEAVLPRDVEERAIRHGAIELIERSDPRLRPGSWRLPRGWNQPHQ